MCHTIRIILLSSGAGGGFRPPYHSEQPHPPTYYSLAQHSCHCVVSNRQALWGAFHIEEPQTLLRDLDLCHFIEFLSGKY